MPVALVALMSFGVSGCGGEDEPAPPRAERPAETSHPLPELPRGWQPYLNRSAGLQFGRPPGWDVAEQGTLTVIRAPDELVVLSVTVDRTSGAVASDPKEFVTQTAELLPGYRGSLRFTRPRPFAHRYDGAVVKAKGTTKRKRVKQRIQVIALERPRIAMVTAVIAENAKVGARAEVRQAERALRTLRTRPPA